MNKLLILVSLLSIISLSRGGCWTTIADQAMPIFKGLEAVVAGIEGDGVSLVSMDDLTKTLSQVCVACSKNCAFLTTLAKDLTCAVDLLSEFKDATESFATAGLDIFADWDFLWGLYGTFEACDAAVKATVKYADTHPQVVKDIIQNFESTDTESSDGDILLVTADDINYHPDTIKSGDTSVKVYYDNDMGSTVETPFIVIDSDSSDAPPNSDFEGQALQLDESDGARQWIFDGALEYMQEISQPTEYPVTNIVCTSFDGMGDTAINLNCSLNELATGEWQCAYYTQCVSSQDIELYWLPLGPLSNCSQPATLIYADAHPNPSLGLVGGCTVLQANYNGTTAVSN